ncbi:hypothetical protein [Thiohalophilus sp.]|uniref:hypothetical protein n=1 Tax=Thiohalophilus sp. TaxID=3028392 RepID=UPI002ACE0DF4|nr:hypothetical protein [Thiohalophilus sp.]MDZ7661794.1 hypothetical protein [Thiohalophilus sp.]
MIPECRLPIRLCLLALLLGGFAPAAFAGTYKCWTNEDGVRECGQSVPPEYSQQRIEILNQQGVVIEVEEAARTQEELEQEKRTAEQRKLEQEEEEEKRRQDHILLSTFTTERDLRMYYQDKGNSIQRLIDITRSSNQSRQEKLNELQKRAANLDRRGESLPETLLKEMEQLKRQIANNEKFIADKQQELEQLDAEYETKLKRFRELNSTSSR